MLYNHKKCIYSSISEAFESSEIVIFCLFFVFFLRIKVCQSGFKLVASYLYNTRQYSNLGNNLYKTNTLLDLLTKSKSACILLILLVRSFFITYLIKYNEPKFCKSMLILKYICTCKTFIILFIRF